MSHLFIYSVIYIFIYSFILFIESLQKVTKYRKNTNARREQKKRKVCHQSAVTGISRNQSYHCFCSPGHGEMRRAGIILRLRRRYEKMKISVG